MGLVWESMTGFRLILTAPRSVAESAWARSTTMPSSCIRPTTCSPAGVNPILGAWRTLSPSSLFRFQLQEERRLDSAREAPIAKRMPRVLPGIALRKCDSDLKT